MLLRKQRRQTSVHVNMTPMIDVVFLLIIFFMTVSQVSKVNTERVELPRLSGSQDQQPATIIVNINREGQIVISGAVYSTNQLTRLVLQQLEKIGNDPTRLTIVVRGDQRGTSQTLNEVIKLLRRIDVKRIRLAVQTEG